MPRRYTGFVPAPSRPVLTSSSTVFTAIIDGLKRIFKLAARPRYCWKTPRSFSTDDPKLRGI